MNTYKSEFLQILADRGFIHQVSDAAGLDALAAEGSITAYVGFDATAPSLHIGNLLTIMMLRWLQKTGHKPIALMGGGTSKIGDPSGKDASRTLLSNERIDANIASIRTVFDRFLDFPPAIMANNADWLDRLTYIPFLREVGRHFTINRMLTFDSVQVRLDREQPLTFLEFNYMILQAYDFVELFKRHGCILQMGGSDQWGNIINGVELGRRMHDAQLFALTTPLLLTSAGTKMGKTETGSVWLNADMMSPYEYWQFWRNTNDADVVRFLKLFTDQPLSEIKRLGALRGDEINDAKRVLATEATKLLHGEPAAERAADAARTTFEERSVADVLPSVEISVAQLDRGLGVLNALVIAGLAASVSEARHRVRDGALRVNDIRITDYQTLLTPRHLTSQGVIKVALGRKQHVLLRATRGQHYVPQFYLKGFSVTRQNRHEVCVFDRVEERSFQTTMENIGLRQEVATDIRSALDRIIATQSIKKKDDKDKLLQLMAQFAPQGRPPSEMIHVVHASLAKIIVERAPSKLERQREKSPKKVSFAFNEANVTNSQTMDRRFPVSGRPMMNFISQFDWVLIKAPQNSGGFVASDRVFSFTSDNGYEPDLLDTEAVFPISNYLVLLGTHNLDEEEQEIDRQTVAEINGIIIGSADRQIYACDANFSYAMQINEFPQKASLLIQDPRFRRHAAPS